MNKAEKPTLRQKWRGSWNSSTVQDPVRYPGPGQGLVLFLLIVAGLMWVVEKITG